MTTRKPQIVSDRLPPHNDDAEKTVIAALLLEAPACYVQVAARLGKDVSAFYDLPHQILYETITRMMDNDVPVNTMTVCNELREDGQKDNIGGAGYLAELEIGHISIHGLPYWLDILCECRRARRLIEIGTRAAGAAMYQHEIQVAIAEASAGLDAIGKESAPQGSPGIRELVQGAISQIERYHAGQGALDGIATGLTDLDKITRGLHAGEMIVIAGRPATGKTSLAMNIAEHCAIEQGLPVGVFSLEMTAESLVTRMLCSRARVNLRSVMDGFLAERDFPKLTVAAGKLAKAPLYIDDTPNLSVWDVECRARAMVDAHGIKLLVIDYLQLMCGAKSRYENRQTEVADMSSKVKGIAKKLRIPVLCLAQLNREQEKGAREPRLSDLRESGAIEADADVVAMLYRPSVKGKDAEEDSSDSECVNLKIAKQRNGPTGTIPLTFLKCYTRFESAAKVSQDDLPSNYREPHND